MGWGWCGLACKWRFFRIAIWWDGEKFNSKIACISNKMSNFASAIGISLQEIKNFSPKIALPIKNKKGIAPTTQNLILIAPTAQDYNTRKSRQ